MHEQNELCHALAAALVADPSLALKLPNPLPCTPLDLLVALHLEVRQAMLSDPVRAGRAAAVARLVAEQFPNNPIHQAQAHWSSGSAILYLPDYVGALAHYDSALEWYERARAHYAPAEPPRDVRAVQVVRVFCLSELGRYREAQAAVAAAEGWLAEHPDSYVELTLLLNRGQLAGRMGLYTEMLAQANATISVAADLGYGDREAQGWLNRANACIFLGRYAEAAEAVERAQRFAEEAEEGLTVARARVCRAWLMHTQGQIFAALSELRIAAELFLQAPGETATVLLEEATISAQLHQWPEALAAARQAAVLFAAQAMDQYSADAALQAARIATRMGQARAARQFVERVRAYVQTGTHPLLDPTLVLTESSIAILPAPELSPTALRRTRQRSRIAASAAVEKLAAAGFDLAAAEGKLIECSLYVQLGKPEAAIAGYRLLLDHPHPTVRIEAHGALGALLPPDRAFEHLEVAAELTVLQRRALPTEELQARYSGETAPIHMRLAACALALGQPGRAAAAIWEAKAGPILDLRAAAETDLQTHTLLVANKTELARLNRAVDEHRRMAYLANGDQQHELAAYHLAQAQVVEVEAQAWAMALTSQLRTLGDRGGRAAVPGLTAVQSALGPGNALLEWFQVDEQFYAMLVLPAQPPVFHLVSNTRAVAKLLDRWSLIVHRYEGAAQEHGSAAIQQVLQAFGDLLLAPWLNELASLERIVVAPTGQLYHIPWAALLGRLASQPIVLLTPSGGLWVAPVESPTTPPGPPRILGAAGTGPGRLEHVEAEVTAIAAHLPQATVRLQATVADLHAEPAPRLLHIAAHGQTNASAPLCSTLELADAPFLLLEAHRLNLRGTALVVLSACETSVRPDHGDMVLALAGAFLCAGAGAVVASLWRVDDAATTACMAHFYRALAAGVPPDAALQLAQRAIQLAHPLDYAAFQLWAGAASVTSSPLTTLITESAASAL